MRTQIKLMKNLAFTIVLALSITFGFAQEAKEGDSITKQDQVTDLAAAIQNPVASMVAIPFQYNWDMYSGVNMGTLNVQPVLPFRLGKSVNLISRTIIPLITKPNPATPDSQVGKMKGIGNISEALLFTPAKVNKLIWAIGPTLTFGTVTPGMGSNQFLIAPSLLILYQTNGWSIGALTQNSFNVAGPSNEGDISLFYSQVFITKSFKSRWYISTAPILTANWKAEKGKQWTVPLGLGIGKLSILNKLPINWRIDWYGFVEHPAGAHSQLRFQVNFILPTLYKK